MGFWDGFAGFGIDSGLIGLIGVLIYIGSYFALQLAWLRGNGYAYPALVIVAAACVLFDLRHDFNLPAALIQGSFILISLVGLTRRFLIDRERSFSAEERAFLDSKLPGLHPYRARRFLNAGRWVDKPVGETITEEGQACPALTYVATGRFTVWAEGRELYRHPPDALIGEITCLSKTPATATCIISQPARCFEIEAEALRRLAARDAELRMALEAAFARDVRQKMLNNNAAFRRLAAAAAEAGISQPA
jgi:hypothetical protein